MGYWATCDFPMFQKALFKLSTGELPLRIRTLGVWPIVTNFKKYISLQLHVLS